MVYNNHLLYSKKPMREKTFVNFVAICAKVFSRVWHLLVAPVNNPRKFSPRKFFTIQYVLGLHPQSQVIIDNKP